MDSRSLCLLAAFGMLLLADSTFAAPMTIVEDRQGPVGENEPPHADMRVRRDAIGYLDDEFHAHRQRRGNGRGRGSRDRFYLRWLARQRYQRYRDLAGGSNQEVPR